MRKTSFISRPSAALRAVFVVAIVWASYGSAVAQSVDDRAPASADDGTLRPGRAGLGLSGAAGAATAAKPPTTSKSPASVAPPASPPTASGPAEVVWPQPTPSELPDLSPHWVPVVPSDRGRTSADAGPLKGVRVLSLADGAARLQLVGEPAPRSLHVGDRIGGDTVVRIEATRVVLSRPAAPGEKGEATVVVKAGRGGVGWVRVYSLKGGDPQPTGGAIEPR